MVGVGSLGENDWSYPPPKGPKHRISYIPFVGIQKKFQGEPEDAEQGDKFAYQILDDLIERASTKSHLYPVIGLSVDRDNKRAIRFYEKRSFVSAQTPRQDKRTGVWYERMFVNIADVVAEP